MWVLGHIKIHTGELVFTVLLSKTKTLQTVKKPNGLFIYMMENVATTHFLAGIFVSIMWLFMLMHSGGVRV